MGTGLKANGIVKTVPATMRKKEKDRAIVRGVTLGMFDWSNSDCYAGAGNVTGQSSFNNLVVGGAPASIQQAVGSYLQPVQNGLLRVNGAVTANGYPAISLPAAWNLGATVSDALDIVWWALPQAGWPANSLIGIFGSGTGNGTALQRHLWFQTDPSGNITGLTYRMRGSAANIDLVVTGSALAALFDGNLHQVGIRSFISGGVGQAILYRDGVILATGGTGAMTQFNQVGGTPSLLVAPGVASMISAVTPAGRVGRTSVCSLTGRTDVTVASLLTADIKGAAGYIS